MNTKTSISLGRDGIVRCKCGCIADFAEDIYKYILPIMEDTIQAEINYKQITVYPWDTADSICEKFKNTMRW